MSKRCFVISPIGKADEERRKHADNVFEFIIQPAMEQCGIEVFRSDHLNEPGRISKQMMSRILNDDLCVAVLTGENPNCYYELAIAQAARRPVVIMLADGEDLPFDVQDLRCVFYDFDPRAIRDGTYVNALVDQVKSLEAANWEVEPIIDEIAVGGGGASANGDLRFVPQSADFGTDDVWLNLLRETESRFDVMGISLGSWRNSRGFPQVIVDKAATGCQVRILLMDPQNPALPVLINDALEQAWGADMVSQEINWMHGFFTRLADTTENIEVRQISSGCPHFQITLTDERGLCIPYTYSDRAAASPLFECSAGHPLRATLEREFEGMWEANA